MDLQEVWISRHFWVWDSIVQRPESSSLWSNNPSLVAMAEDCFETLWSTAPELAKNNT